MKPVTDAEIEAVSEGIREQRDAIREALEDEGVDTSDWDDAGDE